MSVDEGRVCNRETSTKKSSFYKASSFCKVIASFDFTATLVLTRSILDITPDLIPVTELLQGNEIDIADASHILDSLKSEILSKQNTVDEFHNNCYRIILETANKVSINTAQNTLIPLNFLMWRFCGKVQFLHSFGQIAQYYVETVFFPKISIPGN